MDPVKEIKDLVIALNTVPYDDDVRLEFFLAQVKETLRRIFGFHSQYLTYLSSINFRPISPMASAEECVRSWAKGKRQLRDLLFVVLEDSVLKEYESWDERELERESEVEEAERIVAAHQQENDSSRYEIQSTLTEVVRAFKNKVRVDLSVAERHNAQTLGLPVAAQTPAVNGPREMPRMRVDLRDLNILDDGVEEYLVHRSAFLPKDHTKKIFFVPSWDDRLNQKVRRFLNATEAMLVETADLSDTDRSFHEKLAENTGIQMAVVVLSADCWIRFKGDGQESARNSPSPAVCFQLGYLLSKLGRGRVIALYEESPSFRRPTGYFDLLYVSMTSSGVWRGELAQRLKQNKISVKDAGQPFFYRG